MKTKIAQQTYRLLIQICNILFLLVFNFTYSTVYAQSPQKMTYQSVVRDASNNLLTNTTIGVEINVLRDSSDGTNVYTETYSPTPQTDNNGWLSLVIGSGTPSTGVFSDIDWANGPYFLKVNIDPDGGGNYTITGTSQLLSVPYALYAETSGNTNGNWSLSGNIGIDPIANFIGTTDDQPLKFKVFNLPFGELNESTGSVFFGEHAGLNTAGIDNIGIGEHALRDNTTGFNNIAMGKQALSNNTTGYDNIGIGNQVLKKNMRGSWNIAIGLESLSSNKLGVRNIAIGKLPLHNNEVGQDNIAIGNNSLYSNDASRNIGIGEYTLYLNTTGTLNTAIGVNALISNSLGNNNTAIGNNSMIKVSFGSGNTAIGKYAMTNVTTSSNNTALGSNAMPNATGFNNTAIGYEAEVGNPAASHQVRIGNTKITSATIQVAWTVTSDKKWKEQIRTLPYGLGFISQLKPVDYIRKNNADNTREIGFIAQDIEKLLTTVGYSDQGFLTKDSKGDFNLRYNDLIPLLTKAIQELDHKNNIAIQELNAKNEELQKRITKLEQ